MKKEEEFRKEQKKWITDISLKNTFQIENVKTVAGIDIAYWSHGGKEFGVCCIVVIEYTSRKILETVEYVNEINIPYMAGYLAFRELPLVMGAVKKLQKEPDIYMFDGNGYLHYRNMGIATHASFYLKKPTIGVAKSYLKINNTDFDMPKNEYGNFTKIIIDNKTYGAALRTRKNVKPIFVSSGNWIDLETAINITLNLVNKDSRLPIPTRYADLETNKSRRKFSH